MGDESDAPAYLAAVGVALLLGAVWVIFVPFNGLPRPVAPVAAAALAASMFAVAAAAKAADRRRTSA